MIVAKGAGRPARVGGELAGVAAAGVDARSAEHCLRHRCSRRSLIRISTQPKRVARRLRRHPNLSLTLLVKTLPLAFVAYLLPQYKLHCTSLEM
jgi:hypothetical protein